uniref:Asparagine synthase (Glutamine-hydrolyzing) (AsnB, ASNS) n=1 Tax=uncultured marine thaumarchaeote KM3_82_A11 TaxID=1456301 RepID=A0A075HNX5_9ARCH|nr:asparagine synthase (glutamine-hydrolyzing) (asnB, ASNS) [uncultured marine thaumarchaeote KM3_82_A11]
MVTISKLNPTQLESIKQILTLRYSTNLRILSPKLLPVNFHEKQIDEPEKFVEKSIRETISQEIGTNTGKIGISLSSGIDSTLILALLREEYPSNEIESISVKFSESTDETDASQKISEKFQTNHHILEIDNFLEELPKAISIVKQPFWDLHWYYLVKKMKDLTNVFLSGDGGDELFGGYTFRYKKFIELTAENSTTREKIIAYINCHERDWVPDQEKLFHPENKFLWDDIYKILEPYFDNSLSPLTQVFLADYNGKLLHNMQPLYSSIHKHFDIQNIAPIQNKRLLQFSCEIPNRLKYDSHTNSGKILLARLLEKFNVKHLVSLKKQGFSVNTINMWESYGKDIFLYYFDKSRLLEDKIINSDWIKQYASKDDLNVRYVNKLLGLLALEIWYRLSVTNDIDAHEKLQK